MPDTILAEVPLVSLADQARDPDGFVGPYTAPQAFTVPNCLRDGQQRCVGGADGGSVLISP